MGVRMKYNLSIAEKALKGRAVSHGTRQVTVTHGRTMLLTKPSSLSPATALSRAEMPIMIEAKKLDKHPYAIFNFKYRSRGGQVCFSA